MSTRRRWAIYTCAAAAVLAAPLMSSGPRFVAATAQAQSAKSDRPAPQHADKATNPATVTGAPHAPPSRTPFTAAEDAAAVVPGMPDARFWGDSATDFNRALPPQPGPWLILSTGGADGAFGAGLLNGLSAAGNRPDYAVVTGVSTGALMAPFAFAGLHYDAVLKAAYTQISAADIFEAGGTGESFVDSWPLKDLIAKEITPALLTDIAAEHRRGRRLFVVTTDLDAERSVVWNMGAIAAHGGPDALNLFRTVLLASGSIPGAFPPVLIGVESNGKRFSEMHVDGGVGGQFFVAPAALMDSSSGYRIPATQLYIVVNSRLGRDFQVVQRSTPLILSQAVGMAVDVDLRLMLDRTFVASKNSGIGFNVATIPQDFNAPSRGPFDPQYMRALFDAGYDQGKGAAAFATAPPPYPGASAVESSDIGKPGVTK